MSIFGKKICVVLFSLVYFAAQAQKHSVEPALLFIENKNQWPKSIDFSARIPGGFLALKGGQFVFDFIDEQKLEEKHLQGHQFKSELNSPTFNDNLIDGHAVQMDFIGSRPRSWVSKFGESSTYYNYFIGADSTKWSSGVHAYDGVLYDGIYDGIDLKIYSEGSNVKYDYIISPGADPALIKVRYSGSDLIYILDGDLHNRNPLTEIVEKKPLAYQTINGKTVFVECQYKLASNVVTFTFPNGYDSCHNLIIDPLLIVSTYSGSTADNWGSTATPGEHGNLYSAGVTNEQMFGGKYPTTAGAFQVNYGGIYDVGILKYDSTGRNLLYASYLGGSFSESPHSIVMNSKEELVVLGTTSSSNFPTTNNAFDRIFDGGVPVSHVVFYDQGSDIFLCRISKDGKTLLGSTYFGGLGNDGLNDRDGGLVRNYGDELRGDIITNSDNDIYVGTVTSSNDLVLKNGLKTNYIGGLSDGMVLRFKSDLTELVWGTFIGGTGVDAVQSIKMDRAGNIFIAGGTNSNDMQQTPAAFQSTIAGEEDGWIAKLNGDGNVLLASTLTGTDSFDQIYFIDLNSEEEVYVYGQTDGIFPITPDLFSNPGSGQFLQKFDNNLTESKYSTVFGSGRGIPDISPTAFLVSECNNIYMAGWGGLVNSEEDFWLSDTEGMQVTSDAFQTTTSGSDFYLISLGNDASKLLFASFLGGNSSRTHVDGGTCRFDKSGIVYHAVCAGCAAFNETQHSTSDFPVTAGAWSRTNKSVNCNNAAFKFDFSSLKAQFLAYDANAIGEIKVCNTEAITLRNLSIGGEQFLWDFGDGSTSNKSDTAKFTHKYKDAGKYTITLRAVDENTCTKVDTAYVNVNIYDGMSKVQADSTYCPEKTLHPIKANGGVFYDWTSNNKSFESHDTLSIHLVRPMDTTTYYVKIREASGCIHLDTVQLNIIPEIKLDFSINQRLNCSGYSEVEFQNQTTDVQNTDKIFFDFGDGHTSDLDVVNYHYSDRGQYSPKLIGLREFCTFENVKNISIFSLFTPNVITPGDADANNELVISFDNILQVTPQSSGAKVSLDIYNRWGNVVFHSTNYQNDWTGDNLVQGVYFYEVTVEGQKPCKSWLQIIK